MARFENGSAEYTKLKAQTTGTADLKLSKVKSLVPQLSSGEWLASLPGADKQKAFLTMALGGPNSYQGRGLEEAHAALMIDDHHVDLVARHLSGVLLGLGVAPQLVDEVIAAVDGLRPTVLGRS